LGYDIGTINILPAETVVSTADVTYSCSSPERLVTGLTQGVLKFAAGDDKRREQVSSTWYVRLTRGMEIYVLNREAGGNRAHISFHKDGRCHYKVEDPRAKPGGRKIAEWELPAPIEETGMLRLATVVIPHRGLVVPENFAGVDPETVLIPPPSPDQQLEVDILLEPGAAPRGAWPGQTAGQGTLYVGRFSLHKTDPVDHPDDHGLLHCTVVSTPRPEGQSVKALSTARIEVADGSTRPVDPRTVLFEMVEFEGQKLPVLTEMPLGHWT